MTASLPFIHAFEPGTDARPPLLLLHGTGGSETDLLPLGRAVAPDAALLSPRGQVLENGMPRFFRRISEGVFDVEDLELRAGQLADFVSAAAGHYRFDPSRVIAMGFSNGANIASGMMFARPGVLKGAILFRGTVPFEPDPGTQLAGTRVLISNGEIDPMVAAEDTNRLARLLQRAGADVEVHWQPAGHQLMPSDFAVAKTWLQSIK